MSKTSKRLLCGLAALLMIVPVRFAPVHAEERTADSLCVTGECHVNTIEDLALLDGDLEGRIFVLQQDLDFTGKNWIPKNPRNFEFDGNDKKIINLTVNSSTSDNLGLFGSTWGSNNLNIHDLTLINPSISGHSSLGVLVGKTQGGQISNITVIGAHITANGDGKDIGGIVGYSYASYENCIVQSSVLKTTVAATSNNGDNVGGIVGYLGEGNSTVKNSKVLNTELDGVRKVGGIVGSTTGQGTIIDSCISQSNTIKTRLSADITFLVKKVSAAGGILGEAAGKNITLRNNGYLNTIITAAPNSSHKGDVYGTDIRATESPKELETNYQITARKR